MLSEVKMTAIFFFLLPPSPAFLIFLPSLVQLNQLVLQCFLFNSKNKPKTNKNHHQPLKTPSHLHLSPSCTINTLVLVYTQLTPKLDLLYCTCLGLYITNQYSGLATHRSHSTIPNMLKILRKYFIFK